MTPPRLTRTDLPHQLACLPPDIAALIDLAYTDRPNEISVSIAQFLAALSHPDMVCCLTSLADFPEVLRGRVATTFCYFLELPFDSEIRAVLYSYLLPVFLRMPGPPIGG